MFKSAKIKLTSWYLLVIMLITISFSLLVYTNFMIATKRALKIHEMRIETRLNEFPKPQRPPIEFQTPITQETIKDLNTKVITTLMAINISILVIAGLLGYWLSGKTLRPIEEMTEKQKKFVADAAHEFKTPLAAMKTYLEVNLRNKDITLKKATEIMEETLKDIDLLTLLSTALLEQSKNQQNTIILQVEKTDIRNLIEQVVNKFETNIKNKNIKLEIKLKDGKNKEVKNLIEVVDQQKVSQLLAILLDNAIKFSKKTGKISIEAKQAKDHLNITISDTGIGIAEKDLPYIFDRFYKADNSRSKTEHAGFGLGLSIAKEIVDRYKGKINVSSELTKGTTFLIKLPCRN